MELSTSILRPDATWIYVALRLSSLKKCIQWIFGWEAVFGSQNAQSVKSADGHWWVKKNRASLCVQHIRVTKSLCQPVAAFTSATANSSRAHWRNFAFLPFSIFNFFYSYSVAFQTFIAICCRSMFAVVSVFCTCQMTSMWITFHLSDTLRIALIVCRCRTLLEQQSQTLAHELEFE